MTQHKLTSSQKVSRWHSIKQRLALIGLACNFTKPVTSKTICLMISEQQALTNQLQELGVDSQLSSELAVDLAASRELRKLAGAQLTKERLNKLANQLLESLASHAEKVASGIPLFDSQSEIDAVFVPEQRTKKLATLLLATELILLKECRGHHVAALASSRAQSLNMDDWYQQVLRAYWWLADYLQRSKDPACQSEAKTEQLYLYPIVSDNEPGLWIGSEYGIWYGSSSIFAKLSDKEPVLTAREIEIISQVAFKLRCGFWRHHEGGGRMPESMRMDKYRDRKIPGSYSHYLHNIYIMGDAKDWAALASLAEKHATATLVQQSSEEEWNHMVALCETSRVPVL